MSEILYRIGVRRKAEGNGDLKEHVNGLQSAVRGIPATCPNWCCG